MDATSYLQAFITVGGAIMGIWGFIKVIGDIKHKNDDEVIRQDRINKIVKLVEEKHEEWDKSLEVYTEHSSRFDEQDAKIQQLLSMLCMSLRAQDAILEALVGQGIGNGEIKSMQKELKDFILDQVQ